MNPSFYLTERFNLPSTSFLEKAEDILAIIGTMQRFGFRFLVATAAIFFSWLLGVPGGTVYLIQQGGREEVKKNLCTKYAIGQECGNISWE